MRSSMIAGLIALTLCEAAINPDSPGAPGATTSGKPAKAKAEVEKVTMEDGREVEFAGKRKLLKEVLLGDGSTLPSVRFDFRNGKTRVYQLASGLVAQFAAHGASQKIGDETAGEEDVDDMVLAVDEIIDRLSGDAPEWTVKREGGGFGGVSVLLKALVEHSANTGKPKTEEQIKAWLKPKAHGEKMALRAHAPIKVIVDRLEAEKAAKAAGASKVNAGDLLGALADLA